MRVVGRNSGSVEQGHELLNFLSNTLETPLSSLGCAQLHTPPAKARRESSSRQQCTPARPSGTAREYFSLTSKDIPAKLTMDTFAARLNATEGTYFRSEQQNATKRHLAKLVEQGTLPKTALEAVGSFVPNVHTIYDVPITVINSRPASEVVFKYNGVPVPRMSSTESWARLGTAKVSLGRGKWSADGASIFSVQDGKRLAQTPPKEPSAWELNRQRKIANAAVDTRVVKGMRLMPEYTPARALFWGSILAVWGTGAVVASTAKGLGIHNAEDAATKMRAVAQPMVDSLARAFEPYKGWFTQQDTHANLSGSLFPVQQLAREMRDKLGHEQQHSS